MFWLASRPAQAMTWSQAGGSLRADSAGVWWSSMPLDQRVQYLAFVENRQYIEADWDHVFGDRKNEIVLIGQDMDQARISVELDACLATEDELLTERWKQGYEDSWPVQRAYPLN